MKKIKKAGCLVLSLCMIVVLLAACAESEPVESLAQQAQSSAEASQTVEASTEPTLEQMGEVNSNPLSDVRVRQAINYAIDKEALIQLMGGEAVAANSLTPNTKWKVDGLEDYLYNPEKAKELLTEANWDPNYELDLVYYYGDQLTVDLMTAVQAYLADVGIKVNPRKVEGDLSAILWSPPEDPINGPSAVEWDLCYAGLACITEYEYYNRFMTGAGTNSHTPGNDTLDALLKRANNTNKIEEQMEIFGEIQRFENQFLPVIPLYYQQLFIVESDRLTRNGAPYGNEQYNYDWKIQTWDIEPDEDGKKIMRTNGGPMEFFETPFVNPGAFTSTKLLFDHLIVADGDLQSFRGQMASDYSVSEDGKTISFELKEGLTWHDGSAITPEDVKFTWELAAKAPALNVLFSGLVTALEGYQAFIDGEADEITGIVVDGNTITFNFDSLFPNAVVAFSQMPPLPKTYLEDVDPLLIQQDDYWQSPIGSGPYMIDEVSMNNYAVFVPFEDYHEGVGIIEEIHLYPSGESDENIVKNASSGDLDYAYTKSLEDVSALREVDNINIIPFDMNYTRLIYVNKFPKE